MIGYNSLLSCNCKPNDVKNIQNTKFVGEVVQSWCNIKYISPVRITMSILWNKSDIRENGKIMFVNFAFKKKVCQ